MPARLHAAGDADQHITSGGRERSYILHVPAAYDGTRALPLVFNFHGYGSNAREQARYSRLPAKADEEGFIVVTPDATGNPQAWNNIGLPTLVDDVGLVRELLDHLAAELCIDARRVYAAGMSNGAAFAQRLACEMPERLRAVAAVTALVYPQRCSVKQPMPVIAFHGTEDPCVPFEGGTTQCGGRFPVPAIEESARRWAEHDGCSTDASLSPVSEHVRSIVYSGCDNDAEVVLYVVEEGGHTWPGSVEVPRLGATTREIDATDLIWAFFAARR